MTSIGSGKRPSTSTRLPESIRHTNLRLAAAMIFSRVSAPPPPLIRRLCGSHSSAPSTYTPRVGPVALRSSTGMPSPLQQSRALLGARDTAPSMRSFMRAERLDEKSHGRASADADDAAFFDIFNRALFRRSGACSSSLRHVDGLSRVRGCVSHCACRHRQHGQPVAATRSGWEIAECFGLGLQFVQ